MDLRSLFESRTERLGVRIKSTDFKKIMDKEGRKFHFKWLTNKNFIISLHFSVGSNLVFDVHRPNTRSDIIFYGTLTETEKSKTEIELKTRSKYFLAILSIVLALFVLGLQPVLEMELPLFVFALLFFPLTIIGFLNIIRSEEKRLLRLFKEHLNHEILTLHNHYK